MTIWLVRHGESEANAFAIRHGCENDSPLTMHGFDQAKKAAQFYAFKSAKYVNVYCSPMLRTYGTAALLANAGLWQPPIVVEELIERRFDSGSLEWVDSVEQVAADAAKFLAGVRGDAIVVTHAGVMKGLLGLDKSPANGEVIEWRP